MKLIWKYNINQIYISTNTMYRVFEDTIIFTPKFNEPLGLKLLKIHSQLKKLIINKNNIDVYIK